MCFFFSLIPATFWVTIGYFVLYSSTKSEGKIKDFGCYLATWIFIIAAFFPLCGAYVTLMDLCPMEDLMNAFLAKAQI